MDIIRKLLIISICLSCIVWSEVFRMGAREYYAIGIASTDIKDAINYHGILPEKEIRWSEERQEWIFIRDGRECLLLGYKE